MRPTLRRRALGLGTLALAVAAPGVGSAAVVPSPISWSAPGATISLTPTGSYETGIFDASAQEIVAYHAGSNRLFTVNAQLGRVEVIDAATMSKLGEMYAGLAKGAYKPVEAALGKKLI